MQSNPSRGILRPVLRQKQVGLIHAFASACFFVFGLIYFFLLDSTYLLLTNSGFGILCLLNWTLVSRLKNEHLAVQTFLAVVYLGLANVVIHIGDIFTPMIYWGLTVPLAAAFMCRRQVMVRWAVAGALFFPFCIHLKTGPLAARVIELSATQHHFLQAATFLGILLFVAFAFYIFQSKVESTWGLLQEKQNVLENLVRVVCHDISAPITALRLRVELTLDYLNQERPSARNAAAEEARFSLGLLDRITQLIDQIRRYSQARHMDIPTQNEVADLARSVEESRKFLEHLLAEKKLRIQIEKIGGPNWNIRFNSENLTFQIFANVLSNAIKFSPPDSQISILLKEEGDCISAKIQDQGVGIPEEILSQLGNPSASISRPGTRGEKGLGYGIAITKAYLEKYGATVDYRSVEKSHEAAPSGTTVTLKFLKATPA